ncbi:putative DNA repair helicase rad5 [Aspergillus affinis]|uniref:putative DNA repair helicase rad5 n=1 Tax=Aspergillus affinis TaxID=1070780 RepID=UPI0022FE4810|nr:putative DNA repair helicase rad5 [Aspergillus affinis]KAI9035722.1 putative DNA repair helicase rad5 [Aspergillus affinis]
MTTLQFSSDEDGLDDIINADNDTLEDIDQENTLAGFDLTEISNLKGICTALETVTSVKELKKWLKGTLFRPHFLYCYLHAILPAQSSGDNMNRGESFTTIIARIHAAANSGDTKYLDHFSDKTNWDRADWTAFCLLTLVNVNTRNVDGIFYKKAWTQEHKEKVMWAILRIIRQEFAASRVEKGMALLSVDEETRDLIRASLQTPHPPPSENAGLEKDPRKPSTEPPASGPAAPAAPEKPASKPRVPSKRSTRPPPPRPSRSMRSSAKSKNPTGTPTPVSAAPAPASTPPSASRSSTPTPDTPTPAGPVARLRHWRDELIPATQRALQAVSQTPDLSEPYWQFHLIELCLRLIEEELAEEPAPDASDTGNTKLPHKDNMQDEADETSMTPFKVLMATAGPYSIYHPTGQEVDTLTLAHYTADTIQEAHKDTPDGRVTLSQVTAASIEIAREQQTWLDNLELQRENHEEACEALNISNPDVPKHPAMRINTSFRFWQPVAIYAIAQFRENPLLSGCILADMVGLGKTWMVTGYILHRATTLKGKPTLIICPPHLVWQWAAEIKAVTKRLKVIVYFGDAREDPPVDVKVIPKLAGDLPWMTGPQAHHAVVITSYQTLAQRHGPAEYKSWAEEYGNGSLAEWPKSLRGLFDTMVADEAHTLRNPDTAQWTAARWIHPEWTILVTATPIFNSYNDMAGLLPFLLPPKNDDLWIGVDPKTNPFTLPDTHPQAQLILTNEAVQRFILKASDELVCPDSVVRGLRLRQLWKHLMIRRSLSSCIPFANGKRIGDDIPPSQYQVVFVCYCAREAAQYHRWWKQLRRHLFVQTREGQIIWNMAKYRELTLVTTWLFFRYCHHLLVRASARSLDTQARRLTLGPQLIKKAMQVENQILMRKHTEDATAPAPVTHDIPEQFTDQDVLLYLLRGSPKLRALLSIIQQEVFLQQEKSVVWCTTPAQQFFIAAALHHARIDCRVFHSELNSKERVELVRDFTTKVDECMVLICSYYVNAAGSNLQDLCRNVHLFDTPTSDPLKQQAIGRVSRVGQTRTVKIYDYIVSDSFNAGVFAKNLTKAVPDLVATLNWDMFTDTLDVTGDSSAPSFDIGIWVLNQDDTISKVRHAPMELVPKDQRLSPEDVVKALISTMKASSRIREMSDIDVQYLEGEEARKDGEGPMDTTEDVPGNVAEGSDPKKRKADEVELS